MTPGNSAIHRTTQLSSSAGPSLLGAPRNGKTAPFCQFFQVSSSQEETAQEAHDDREMGARGTDLKPWGQGQWLLGLRKSGISPTLPSGAAWGHVCMSVKWGGLSHHGQRGPKGIMRAYRQPFSFPNCLAPSASLELHKPPGRGWPKLR